MGQQLENTLNVESKRAIKRLTLELNSRIQSLQHTNAAKAKVTEEYDALVGPRRFSKKQGLISEGSRETFGRFWGPRGGTIIIHRNDYKRFRSTHQSGPSFNMVCLIVWSV